MEQPIDLSLADSMGYYRANNMTVKVPSPKNSPNKLPKALGPGAPTHSSFSSPPIRSFSAFNYEDDGGNVDGGIENERPLQLTMIFAKQSELKRLKRTVDDMKRYFKLWMGREKAQRRRCAILVQQWFRGCKTRRSLLAESLLPGAQGTLKAWGTKYGSRSESGPPTKSKSVYYEANEEVSAREELRRRVFGTLMGNKNFYYLCLLPTLTLLLTP